MALDLSAYEIDIDTPRPDGKRGDAPRALSIKMNGALTSIQDYINESVDSIGPEPVQTFPYQLWIDTTVNPPMMRRRNADNDAWVDVGSPFFNAQSRVENMQVGYKNKLINGAFDIWQRGVSQTASGYHSADRWSATHGGSTKTFTRETFPLGQTDVPGNPKYFARTVVNSVAGANNLVILQQRIESVAVGAGQNVTLSFWARADSNKNMAVELAQVFGVGGSPNLLGIGSQQVALTTSWQYYSVTISVPSVAGMTLGPGSDDYLVVVLWFDAGSSYNSRAANLGQQSGTFDIANVQLEIGDRATPFEQRHIAQELMLCQRYFEKSYTHYEVPGTPGSSPGMESYRYCFTGAVELTSCGFRVEKRVPPTVTLYSPNTGASGVIRNNSITSDIGATANIIGSSGFIVTIGGGSGTVDGNNLRWHWTAEAEL